MLTESDLVKIAKFGLKKELSVCAIYLRLAERFKEETISMKLKHFAEAETYHAAFWRRFLMDRMVDPSTVKTNQLKLRILAFVYSFLGLGLTLKLLEAGEHGTIILFSKVSGSALLSPEENKRVNNFLIEELAHEEEFLDYGTRFKFFVDKIGTILTQTSEGLVIVISTAIGLSGVYNNAFLIGMGGLMVAVAAALNTIVAYYFFGRTEMKIRVDIMKRIKLACSCAPEVYQRRVEKYMRRKNYEEETARSIALEAREKNMMERIIAEEEYGIREKALGNPVRGALAAGLFKIGGTILPLIPFLAGYPVSFSIPVSIIITLTLLSVLGAIAAVAAEVDVKRKVAELTMAGLIMSIISFLIGKLASTLTSMV